MSKQQQRQLDAILRQGQFDTEGDVETMRASFSELMAQVPVAPDIQQNPVEIGGVAGVEVTIQGNQSSAPSNRSRRTTGSAGAIKRRAGAAGQCKTRSVEQLLD